MSRAINLRMSEAQVTAQFADLKVAISAIEALPVEGTHVVCLTSEGAELIRRKLKAHLIEGKVKRFAYYRIPSVW